MECLAHESGFLRLLSSSSMGDGAESKTTTRTIEMENLTLDAVSASNFSRDLLQRFGGTSRDLDGGSSQIGEDDEDVVELNLGLSLGGRFGVDKTSSKPLVRSSSIASCLPATRDDSEATAAVAPPVCTALTRTSSLPVETEEEWRKRKEMQSLRRMEAKRRRSEKQRNLRIDKESSTAGACAGNLTVEERKEIEVNLRERLDREKTMAALRRSTSSVRSQLRLSDWAAGRTGIAIDSGSGKGKGSYAGSSGGIQPGSQGSVESRGGSSSSISDLDSRPMAGSSGELSPASIQSLQESGSQDAGSSATTKGREHMDIHSKRPDASSRSQGREIGPNSVEDMPCVFTKGDGPNGRRVDGILYKYGKGADVRIMCICHGTFHSPAEFIRHAGGTDVNNPLKHIVVNPNSSPLL